MKRMIDLVSFVMVFIFCAIGHSATIYVPDDYTTIQGAIDAASSGDTIIVGPGTYYETIDTTGKSLTIQSSDGAESTIIDPTGVTDGYDDFELVDESFQSIDVGSNSAPTFNDVDNDGDQDLVIGNYYGQIYYYENDGSGIFTRSYDYFSSVDVGSYSVPTFADIDGDGDEDLFIGKYSGISYYEKQSDGSFALVTENWQGIVGGARNVPCFNDLDEDGDLDLVIGYANGQLYLYENDTSGTFSIITAGFESIDVGSYSKPAFSDIDHDGDLDLFVGEQGGYSSFFENIGDTDGDGFYNFYLITEYFQIIDIENCAYSFYDYDGDGDEDLFIGRSDGKISYYENLGDVRPDGSVVTLYSSTLDGFTVQNGLAYSGGGIYCTGSSVSVIKNCIIQNNNAASVINCDSGYFIMEKNIIQNNTGYAIHMLAYKSIILYNMIQQNNTQSPYAHSIYYSGSGRRGISKNNIIQGQSGGGIYVYQYPYDSSPNGHINILNNIVTTNTGGTYSGGIWEYLDDGYSIRNNVITDNTGWSWAGAISAAGGYYFEHPEGQILNNTIVSNNGPVCAIFVEYDLPELFNNIIAYDTGTALYSFRGDDSGSNDYNNLYSNSDNYGRYNNITPGLHEIYDDPLFSAFSDDSDWTNDDFSLASGSPCIDSGHPAFEYRDPDGSRADMGAYGGDCADEWDLDGDGYIGGPWGDDPDDMDDTVPGTPHPKVLHYNFDDLYVFDSAGKIVDESIYSNIGDFSGCVSTDGIFSEAMEFDGADYVQVPDSDNLDLTDALSISAWIYPTNLSASGRQWIIRKTNSWGVFLQDGWIYFYTDTRDNGGTWMSAAWVVPGDQWSHVAGTYDSSSGVMNFYINGRLATTRTQSRELNTNDYSLYVGAGNSTPVEGFYGIVDELKVYSDALSEDEVVEDMMDGGRGFKVLHYNFDGGTATDQSSCRNDGSVSGATTDTGIDGSSLLFNGSSSYVSVPDSGTLDITDELTVSAWIYPTSISGSRQMIVDKGSWGLFLQNGWVYFYTRNSSGTWISAAWVVTEDVWSHVAGTYDSSTSTMNFYINGELVTSRAQSGEIRLTDTNLYIGSNSSTPTQVFQGKIDEVRIYNVALNQDMIEYDMQESIPENVLYFNFNDGTATDQSSCENDGTISGATSVTVDSRTGLAFDGGDYVRVEDAVSLDVTEAVTVEAWIYPTNISSTTRQNIVYKGGWGIFIQNSWIYFYTDTRNDGGTWMSAAWVVPEDTWSHVAGVYDERTGTMSFYINGDSVTTRTQSGDVNVNNNDLFIGSANTSGSQPFYGYIDDVRIYNTALSESEIEDDAGL